MKKRLSEKPKATRVVAYIRVSTEQQAAEGASLEAQRARLEAYAGAFGYEIVATEVDAGVSAKTLERPGLKAALTLLKEGLADGLLVVKLDRLTRNVRDLAELVDDYFKDYALLSVHENVDTSTAAGRMVLNLLTTVAQWEREAAAERTAAVMQHLKATGKYTGGFPPFGYELDEDRNLRESVAEQALLISMREMRAAGTSLRTIATSTVNPRTGRVFDHKQIARMI